MYYVYCLISERTPKFHYYGFTQNLEERLSYHLQGKVKTTRRYLPVKLLGAVMFKTRERALDYEKQLKTKASYRKLLQRVLQQECDRQGSPACVTASAVRQVT